MSTSARHVDGPDRLAALRRAILAAKLSPLARLVAIFVLDLEAERGRRGLESRWCVLTTEKIGHRLGVGKRAVFRAFADLRAKGWLLERAGQHVTLRRIVGPADALEAARADLLTDSGVIDGAPLDAEGCSTEHPSGVIDGAPLDRSGVIAGAPLDAEGCPVRHPSTLKGDPSITQIAAAAAAVTAPGSIAAAPERGDEDGRDPLVLEVTRAMDRLAGNQHGSHLPEFARIAAAARTKAARDGSDPSVVIDGYANEARRAYEAGNLDALTPKSWDGFIARGGVFVPRKARKRATDHQLPDVDAGAGMRKAGASHA